LVFISLAHCDKPSWNDAAKSDCRIENGAFEHNDWRVSTFYALRSTARLMKVKAIWGNHHTPSCDVVFTNRLTPESIMALGTALCILVALGLFLAPSELLKRLAVRLTVVIAVLVAVALVLLSYMHVQDEREWAAEFSPDKVATCRGTGKPLIGWRASPLVNDAYGPDNQHNVCAKLANSGLDLSDMVQHVQVAFRDCMHKNIQSITTASEDDKVLRAYACLNTITN
jgi:hypothetical protein